MASDTWYADLESTIFTIVKFRLEKKLKIKYPKLFCTTSSQTDAEPVFPTVFLREIQPVETGMDLENKTVNAVIESLQVDVTTNQSKKDCKIVTTEVVNQLKALKFSIVSMPVYLEEGNVFRGIVRVRRLIGNGDKDLVLS